MRYVFSRSVPRVRARQPQARSSEAPPSTSNRRALSDELVLALASSSSDRAIRLLELSNQRFAIAQGAATSRSVGSERQILLFESAYLALASAESEPPGSHGPLPTELLIARSTVHLDMFLEDVVLTQQLASIYAFAGWHEFSMATLGAWCQRVRLAVSNAQSDHCDDGRAGLDRAGE
jgi:hypothetical protein